LAGLQKFYLSIFDDFSVQGATAPASTHYFETCISE